MGVSTATIGAIGFSAATVIIALFGMVTIYQEVQSVWAELDVEMDRFRAQADDLWTDMVRMGAGTPSNRQRRQAYGGYQAKGDNRGWNPTIVSNPLYVGVGSACSE